MIKWEHSVFALPFALCGALLAARGLPRIHDLAWIVVAMVAARSAAMAFNRLADAPIDAENPRTQSRALPAGTLTTGFVATFVVISCAIFVLAASQLNRLTLLLSPIALGVVLLYSYTKRFTRWSHLVLGFALGIAPAAAWIAVRASFDVLYSCQDCEFDRQADLHSIPRYVSVGSALWVARLFHLLMLVFLAAFVAVFSLGRLAVIGVVVVALLLVYEHSLVSARDLSKLNAAFFTMNGVISVIFLLFVAGDLLLPR